MITDQSPIISNSTKTQSVALSAMTQPAFKLRWIKPANLEQMRNLFLNTLRFFVCYGEPVRYY